MIASKDTNKDGMIELNEMEEDMKKPSTSYIKRIYDEMKKPHDAPLNQEQIDKRR